MFTILSKAGYSGRKILKLGCGTMLAKLDIQSAYRVIPVHPHDRMLLGIKWQENVYVHAALPFGLRSAPKIFNAVADALEWIVHNLGVRFVKHYLDDFVVLVATGTSECKVGMDTLISTCGRVGLPFRYQTSVKNDHAVLSTLVLKLTPSTCVCINHSKN